MTTVKIYERIKKPDGRWSTVAVQLPKLRKKDGKLFLAADRQGKFRISWYEDRKKYFQSMPTTVFSLVIGNSAIFFGAYT